MLRAQRESAQDVVHSIDLHYWYKSTKTDAKGAARWGAEVRDERLEPPDTEVWLLRCIKAIKVY